MQAFIIISLIGIIIIGLGLIAIGIIVAQNTEVYTNTKQELAVCQQTLTQVSVEAHTLREIWQECGCSCTVP